MDGSTVASDELTTPVPAVCVTTRRRIALAPARIWGSLMFYEQIDIPPPFYLRLLLPLPLRTLGSKSAVGDVATCLYEGGYLLKRVTRILPDRLYEFSVINQTLRIGGGLRLCGGSYVLRPLPPGGTDVAVTTLYRGGWWPRSLWQPLEALVCHLFHAHLLRAIAAKAAADGATAAPTEGHGTA